MVKSLEITKKDLKIEFRSKDTINFMLLFALVTSIMFSVSIPVNEYVVPSLLWLIFMFVGMLGYSKAFLREIEQKTIDCLRIAPINPTSVLIGKILYNMILMLLVQIIVLPIFIALFNLDIANPLLLFLSITLGNIGFVVVITFLSALVIKSRVRELLIPILAFPIVFPIISLTVLAIKNALLGDLTGIYGILLFIAGFSIVMFIVAYLTFEYIFID
ncbi:MAG TPA: cytochrome C biogenesis protein [Archaeoglobus profundus]|nr:cytochrome C biogenesis protein [Archaeoglobus profundus]